DEERAGHLLGFFADHLTADGICAVSAHGDVTLTALRSGNDRYGLPEAGVRRVLERFDATGYGYADYGGMTGYGISIASEEKLAGLAARAGLEVTHALPRA
ncbi:MAG: hypothetical protein GWN85_36310, partial [Gemmatimonadetes bacterium]|nr:hypothetical protein [Gemmatimonadota bacterium]NIR40857.1 hypothetical protein [Actinomycetota bacterium]NIS35787.1 hypothetical protein [Actinomycetota bacterium]NIW32302.1 hypothetical protein [Actinomycetota bacterium]NIX24510.1 hypothetical protein [Actinomycetota bacterium]